MSLDRYKDWIKDDAYVWLPSYRPIQSHNYKYRRSVFRDNSHLQKRYEQFLRNPKGREGDNPVLLLVDDKLVAERDEKSRRLRILRMRAEQNPTEAYDYGELRNEHANYFRRMCYDSFTYGPQMDNMPISTPTRSVSSRASSPAPPHVPFPRPRPQYPYRDVFERDYDDDDDVDSATRKKRRNTDNFHRRKWEAYLRHPDRDPNVLSDDSTLDDDSERMRRMSIIVAYRRDKAEDQ